MKKLKKVFKWAEKHPTSFYDVVRIYLGLGLFIRGILFLSTPKLVMPFLDDFHIQFLEFIIIHYVALAHLGGGILLAFGLLTRLAALIQLPILLGAVFLIHLPEGLFNPGQSLEFSALVLLLLILVFIYGPGEWSTDKYLETSAIDD